MIYKQIHTNSNGHTNNNDDKRKHNIVLMCFMSCYVCLARRDK